MLFFMVLGDAPPAQRVRQAPVDEELIAKIGQGDREAFGAFYECTERAVYAYVLSLLRDPDDTMDVVQETYLKVRAAAHLYRPMGKPLAWLFTIARNLCRTLQFRQGRMAAPEEGMADDLRFSIVTDPTDRLVLEEVLQTLGAEEREIVLLHAVSGMRHREIAANLDLPLSTVLSRYNRAIRKLRDQLTREGVSL